MRKRFTLFIVILCMIAVMSPIMSKTAYAVSESANVRNKIDSIVVDLNDKLKKEWVFSVDGTDCYNNSSHSCSNCSLYKILPTIGENKEKWEKLSSNGYSCSAFAKYIFVKTFGTAKNSKDTKNIGEGNKESTYSTFRTGDLFYSKRHWMIFLSNDSKGVSVLEANGAGDLKIRYKKYNYDSKNLSGKITVWQSPNWDKVNNPIVTVQPIPSIPTGLEAVITGANTAKISWNAVEGATYYVECKSPNTGNSWEKDTDYKNSSATSYTATKLENYKYEFRVYSVNSIGKKSKASDVLVYTHSVNGIAVPTDVTEVPTDVTEVPTDVTEVPTMPIEEETIATAITVSASTNKKSGTTSDKYSYTVTTNIAASKITYSFSGNSKLYTLKANGTNNFNSGTAKVSSDKKTWVWSNDTLAAGSRTITITAYDENGNTASTTLKIKVTK